MPFLSRVWKPPARMVLVAFVVRLALILLPGTYHLNPMRDHWRFDWEVGRVARSAALVGARQLPEPEPATSPGELLLQPGPRLAVQGRDLHQLEVGQSV